MTVELWWATIDAADEAHELLLDDAEHVRLRALQRADDRRRFRTAAALARIVLGMTLDVAPQDVALTRHCPDCPRPHGRPRLPAGTGVTHSVSHAGGHVVVAVDTAGADVGVDVEVVDPTWPPPARQLFAPGERGEPWRTWVRKEAALKATGDGLRVPMPSVRWRPAVDGSGQVVVRGRRVVTVDVPAPLGAVACVATVEPAAPLRWTPRDGTEALRGVLVA